VSIRALVPMRVTCDMKGCDAQQDFVAEGPMTLPEGWTSALSQKATYRPPWVSAWSREYCPSCSDKRAAAASFMDIRGRCDECVERREPEPCPDCHVYEPPSTEESG